MSIRIWEKLPAKYKLSTYGAEWDDPYAPVVLMRGDLVGGVGRGFRCYQLPGGPEPEEVVFGSLFVKYPDLKKLVKRHTKASFDSPFISLTGQLALAQSLSGAAGETVYEVTLAAHEVVVDPPRGSEPALIEVLAIGHIAPEAITGVMIGKDGAGAPIWDRGAQQC